MPRIKEINYQRLGQRVKELRKSAGLSQDTLAEKCQISSNYISHIETAVGKPSLEVLFKIASVFHISMDFFLLDTPSIPPQIFIDTQISEQLSECSPMTLQTVSKIITALLEQQNADKQSDT